MKILILFSILVLSYTSHAAVYVGGSYGYGLFSSETLKDYKVSPKGMNYGGFIGVGRDFVGLEGIFHSFTSSAKIKHDGGEHDLKANAVAFGGALRFSFQVFYLRLGALRFNLKQSIDIEDEDSLETANELYDIQDGKSANGMLYGVGFHGKLSQSIRGFVDYTRYQITSHGHYDTFSLGISFNIPERYIGFGKH